MGGGRCAAATGAMRCAEQRRRYSYASARHTAAAAAAEDGPLDLTAPLPEEASLTHSEATGKRYPSQATPGSVLFLVRVVSCLRGIAVSLDVQHSYLEAMRPYAKQALRDALKQGGGGGGGGGSIRLTHLSSRS